MVEDKKLLITKDCVRALRAEHADLTASNIDMLDKVKYSNTTTMRDVKMLREYINLKATEAKNYDVLLGNTSSLYSTYLFMKKDNTFEYLTITANGQQEWEFLTKEEAIILLERCYKSHLVDKWDLLGKNRNLINSRLAIEVCVPDFLKNKKHVAIVANGRPLILLETTMEREAHNIAEKIFHSKEFQKIKNLYHKDNFEISMVEQKDLSLENNEVCIFAKDNIGLRWIVFGANALDLAKTLCISEEIQDITYNEKASLVIAALTEDKLINQKLK